MNQMRRYSMVLAFPTYTLVSMRYHGNAILQTNDFSSVILQFSAASKIKKSVAFFDLDNTLIMGIGYKPKNATTRISGYGNDIWFSNQEKKIKQAVHYSHEQYMMLVAEYCAIQKHLHQTTTEDCVPEKLRELKKSGISIFGLTARSPRIAELTHQNGITFCGGRSKKEGLKSFLKTPLGQHSLFGVQQVLFVDDKKSHCKEMKAFLDEMKVESLVANYTRVENLLPIATDDEIENDKAQLIKDHGLQLH